MTARKKFPCPECGKRFERPQALGSHRQRAHGIPGSSRQQAASRLKQEPAVVHVQTQTPEANRFENHIAYAFGYTESWITSYATSLGVPASVVASRVGELLLHQAGGKVPRA